MNAVIKFLATGFGLGYLPKAPGTYGSLLGLFGVWCLQSQPSLRYFVLVLMISLLAIGVSHRAEQLFGRHDASEIVIDEVAGQMVTFVLIPVTGPTLLAGFLLFRFFDIVKVPPIRQSQKLPGGWGVVVDDLLAGVLANLVLQVGLTCWYLVKVW